MPKTVDEYIATFPKDTQKILREIRALIKKEAPDATEGISYGMPGYKTYGKPLVYFAGWKDHIGFYATPAGNVAFQKELAKYKQAKGSIQFPLDEEMPMDLIRKMVKYRVIENEKKYKK